MICRSFAIIIAVMACAGCATLSEPGGMLYQSRQEHKLAQAVALLEKGKSADAMDILKAVCSEPGVPGVTDEALFRLSLLRLSHSHEKNALLQSRHDLERLKREFPLSSWTPLASGLIEYLISTDDVRQQNRRMKEQYLSTARENRELRQSIEKLKNLELELGKKKRR